MSEMDEMMEKLKLTETIISCRDETMKTVRAYKNAGITEQETIALFIGQLSNNENAKSLIPVTMIWIKKVYKENA